MHDANAADSPSRSNAENRSRTPQSTPTPFFIVQEPVISPSGAAPRNASRDNHVADHLDRSSENGSRGTKKAMATKSRRKSRSSPTSSSSPLSTPSSSREEDTGTPSVGRKKSSTTGATLDVHEEDEYEDDDIEIEPRRKQKKHASLLMLNRVGSAPDLPLHSSVSAGVYSSSKKRNLMKSAGPNGAGPHLVTMQRSRLTPLPINIRTGTLHRDAGRKSNNNSADLLESASLSALERTSAERMQQHMEDKLNDNVAIASLKQRLAQMEKEMARVMKQKHALAKQAAQLSNENQCAQTEKAQLERKVEQLEKSVLQQKHAFERLSDRYASAYGSLQKLTEQQQSSSPDSHTGAMQSVLQALTRENQDFQRKLRVGSGMFVLEARHVEDKAVAANQEKKIKRLRAEMEALQHMNEANARDDLSETHYEYALKSTDQKRLSSPALFMNGKLLGTAAISTVPPGKGSPPTRATPAAPLPASNASSDHLIGAEDYQYIDPNILKVLDKVDSQFSITNAINLSVILKKWLNSCLHVVSSTHIPSLLQRILKRVCELLHCDHAAIFEVDHMERKLIGRYSESGDVSWELPLDKGIIGFSARQNALCNVPRAYDDPRFYSSTDTITGLPSREVLCIPLVHELRSNQPHSVFAVLQAWNTTHQKPFTANDQILGGLLTIQTGTIFLQTRVDKTLQKVNKKLFQILQMPQEIVQEPLMSNYAATDNPPGSSVATSMSTLHLVATAQKKLSECIGIKKVKLFVLDPEVMKIWHVGSEVDATSGQLTLVRKYSNVLSSLCGLVLKSSAGVVLEDPVSEATYNDTVDLKGGAGGMYLCPIVSPWGVLPLGMVQVARSDANSFVSAAQSIPGVDSGFAAALAKEKQSVQNSEDLLLMELIDIFSRMFASLLHHMKAHQLYDTCPQEIQNARLAHMTDRLDLLEREYTKEQKEAEEEEARIERTIAATAMMEQRILESAQRERLQSGRETDGNVASQLAHTYDINQENDAVRRSSFAGARGPQKQYSHDTRRISSAGSFRKGIKPTVPNAIPPDAQYLESSTSLQIVDSNETCGNGGLLSGNDVDPTGSADFTTESVTSRSSFAEDDTPLDHENDVDLSKDGSRVRGETSGCDDQQQELGLVELNAGDVSQHVELESNVWQHEQQLETGASEQGTENEWQHCDPEQDALWHEDGQANDDADDDTDSAWQQHHEAVDNTWWYDNEQPDNADVVPNAGEEWQRRGSETNKSWQDENEQLADTSLVGLISTDSMYAIDLNCSDGSPTDATPGGSESFSPIDEQAGAFSDIQ